MANKVLTPEEKDQLKKDAKSGLVKLAHSYDFTKSIQENLEILKSFAIAEFEKLVNSQK